MSCFVFRIVPLLYVKKKWMSRVCFIVVAGGSYNPEYPGGMIIWKSYRNLAKHIQKEKNRTYGLLSEIQFKCQAGFDTIMSES
jgi:hypothetical protein